MPVTNLLKPQVDLPVFEWLRPCPVATAATNGLVGMNGQTGGRYLYMFGPSQAYRYDTWSDSWQEITLAANGHALNIKMQMTPYLGHRAPVIAATSNTLQIGGCGMATKNAVGMKIRIVSGLGAGQERTITAVADPVIHDEGVSTSSSNDGVTDTTKKWRFNEWDGYSLRILHTSTPANGGQIRKILYNNETVLATNQSNFQQIDPWNNSGFSSISFPAFTTNLQYSIESVTLTVDTNWTVTPNNSSIFMILSGGILVMSPNSISSGVVYPQYYDILADTWQTRTLPQSSHYTTAPSNYSFAFIDESSGAFISGATATSATARTLVNTGATMEVDRFANHQLRIIAGTGVGQQRRIAGHGATFFHIERNWDVIPDSTSRYQVWGDTDKAYICGNGTSAIYQYSMEADTWAPGQIVDYGIARQISASPYSGSTAYGPPHQAFGVTSITRVTNGILSGTVNAAGSNYIIGDLVTCSTSGTLGTFFVTGVNSSGGVTSLELAASGSGYANGSSNTTGGSGTGLTITLSVGITALATIASNIHDFKTGDQITISGCTTDATFNSLFTIIGVGSISTFSIAAPASSTSPTAANSISSTLLVDSTKNWTTNEHTGKLIFITSAGSAPTFLGSRRITSNTATTITFDGSITATNGQSRYVICEPHALGALQTYKTPNKTPTGWVTSATATTLVDATKNWNNNQWQNCRVRIVCGTGLGNESAITSNDATTLTVASWGVATPDSTSKYEIMDSYGIMTSGVSNQVNNTASKLVVNQTNGKRVKVIAGTNIGTEATATSNTATQITVAIGTPATNSYYAVYEPQVRTTGSEKFDWLPNLTDTNKKGRWIISPISNTTVGTISFDLYDIPTNTWLNNVFVTPGGGIGGLGTMYAYDNKDSYFFTIAATGRISELKLDTMRVEAGGISPYAHNTALARNGMEVVTTEDGLKYIYIQRHTGQEMWRTLKFW